MKLLYDLLISWGDCNGPEQNDVECQYDELESREYGNNDRKNMEDKEIVHMRTQKKKQPTHTTPQCFEEQIGIKSTFI